MWQSNVENAKNKWAAILKYFKQRQSNVGNATLKKSWPLCCIILNENKAMSKMLIKSKISRLVGWSRCA
jgi:hypothetical protein